MKKWFLLFINMYVFYFSFGQIIYHNYNPDLIVIVEEYGDTTKYLYCDINNDSIDDFKFTLKYWYSFGSPSANEAFYCRVSPINGQHQLGQEEDFCNIKALDSGDTIWNNLDCGGEGYILFWDPNHYATCSIYPFSYIALKLNFNGNIHYGWFLVRAQYYLLGWEPGSGAILIISEFAYNLEPNCGLIAGDTINSLQNAIINPLYTEENIKIYPNPVTDILVIKNADKYLNLILTDIFGKIVYKNDNLKKVEKIACDNFNPGLYFITFKNSNEVVTQKVIIGYPFD
jgi:hypothetical protein